MATSTSAEPTATRTERLSGRQFGIGLAVITVLAGAYRLWFTLATKIHDQNTFDEGDAAYYSTTANMLAKGHFFMTQGFPGLPERFAADHPPLTIVVLGPASWIWKESVLAQRLTMTLLGTLVVVAVGLLGREAIGRRVGLVAAVVAAINPNLWINDSLIMSESISALLIAVTLLFGFRLYRRPTLAVALIAGAACGLTALARAEVGLLLPFMVWPILWLARDVERRDRLIRIGAATVACGLVLAPWTLLNLTRFEDPVMLSTNDGLALVGAYCPNTYHTGLVGSWYLRCTLDAIDPELDASQNSTEGRRRAVEYARENVGRLPVVEVARHGRTWGLWRPDQQAYAGNGEGRPSWTTWAGFYGLWIMLPFTIAGAVIVHRRRLTTLIPFAATLGVVVFVTTIFYGISRFRLPFDVAACVLTAVTVVAIWDAVRGRSRAPEPTAEPTDSALTGAAL